MKFFAIFGVLVVFTALASSENPSQGEYKVYKNTYAWNNGWNDPQKKIKATFGPGPRASMNVTFDFNDKGIHGYPAICRGWHYNVNPVPGDKLFPQQVSKLKKIPVKFSYRSGGTDLAGDFALDIFFRNDTEKTTPQLEVMIWGDHNSCPLGEFNKGKVITVGGRTFDLWQGFNSGAGYFVYTFVQSGTVDLSGKSKLATRGRLNVDVKKFLNWLQQNKASEGKFSDKMYLDVIEAGFEVVNGKGWVTISADINAS